MPWPTRDNSDTEKGLRNVAPGINTVRMGKGAVDMLQGRPGADIGGLGKIAAPFSVLGGALGFDEGLTGMQEAYSEGDIGKGADSTLTAMAGIGGVTAGMSTIGLSGAAGGVAGAGAATVAAAPVMASVGAAGAGLAAGVGLGRRGDKFFEEHLGMGISDMTAAPGLATADFLEELMIDPEAEGPGEWDEEKMMLANLAGAGVSAATIAATSPAIIAAAVAGGTLGIAEDNIKMMGELYDWITD